MVSTAHTLQLRNRKLHLGPKPGHKRRRLLSWFRDDDFPFLLTLLRRLHTLHATDARDNIYALVSMAGDRRELNITPDYAKSVTAVFTVTPPEPRRSAISCPT
jgi:anaerobic selenocysteine-containing dehydrogenase